MSDPVQIGVRLREALDDALYWGDRGTYVPVEAAERLCSSIRSRTAMAAMPAS